ncbi:MAG: hypothetical protein AAFZ52_09275, partial [Bacteroidota bacterium]
VTDLDAQDKGRPQDRIVFANGSQITVTLRKAAPLSMGKGIAFRRSADGSWENASPSAIKEFQFRKSGRIFRAVNVELPDIKRNGQKVLMRRFGEVLVDGDVEVIKVSLAPGEYNEKAVDNQPYLYLLRQDDVELVLEMTTIMVYEILHANPSRFRNKLKFFVKDCPSAYNIATDAAFNDRDVLRAIAAYGRCESLQNLVLNNEKIKGGLSLRHYGRLTNLDIRDQDYDDRQLSIAVGYQAEARFNNRFSRFGILASVDYVYHSFRWQDQSNVEQSMLKGNISFSLTPYMTDNFRVQIVGGLSNYNALSSSFNSFFSNNYFLPSAGVRLTKNNFLFSVDYEHMPLPISEQPGDILLVSGGYRILF